MRRVLIVLALVVAGGLLFVYPGMYRCHWVGGSDLTVVVANSTPDRLWEINCYPTDLETAELMVKYRRIFFNHKPALTAFPYRKEPLTFHIMTSGISSWWGRELSYRQYYHHMVVIGKFADDKQFVGDKQIWKLVEIPDLRESKSVLVTFP